MVVGSGCGDMSKYVEESVALCGTPSTLGVPLLCYSCLSTAVLGNFGWVHPKRIILFVNVMSLNGAVMSYVMSQCCTCIGHVTFYYKRATKASVGGSCLLFVHSLGLTLSPETCVWLVSNTCGS